MCYIKIYKFYNLWTYTERKNRDEIILVIKYELLQFVLVKKKMLSVQNCIWKNILLTIIFLTKKLTPKRSYFQSKEWIYE